MLFLFFPIGLDTFILHTWIPNESEKNRVGPLFQDNNKNTLSDFARHLNSTFDFPEWEDNDPVFAYY